ncbi:hypothetical protein N2152v2_002441 [Parachlorella kessleri]
MIHSKTVPYHAVCELVRAAGDLLNLPPRSISTALVFCHRFAHTTSENFDGLDPERVASSCIFLASKVEESALRTNDLLNAVRHLHEAALKQPGGSQPGRMWEAAADAEGIAPPEGGAGMGSQSSLGEQCPVLVGDAYYVAKAQLIHDEQVLLRMLRFDIGVEQPHKYLYCFAETLKAPGVIVRLATCLVNDSLVYLQTCISLRPEAVAAAALHVASVVAGAPLLQPEQGSWWEALGLQTEGVEKACSQLTVMLAEAYR